jgi:hypothetical protein
MKIESGLFLLLMVLKSVSVIPLAEKNMGMGYAVFFMALNVVAYGFLIYMSQTQRRVMIGN